MAVEHINETDTMNQGRVKINAILDQSNAASVKVDTYETDLEKGIEDAKQIASDAGAEAVQIAADATASIEATANQANANSQTAINTANNAVSTANQNKQEFDQLRNDFDDLVAEAGDSNPEIVQARTDTTGIKQTTLANRLSVDFADRMTKADGIEMLSGITNVKKMMDFNGKTVGNTATNPHQGFSDFTAKALKKPSDSWNEIGQSDYNKLASRDDSGVSTGSTSNGVIPQQLYKLNAVETVKSMAPQLFDGLDDETAVQFIKDNFVSLVLTIRGKASSPNNKNLKVSMYVASADTWTTQIQGDATEYTDFTVQINDSNFIGTDGFVYAVAYSDLTNGVTASSIDIDYVGVAVEVSINAQDVLAKGGFAKKTDINDAVEPLATAESLQAHVSNIDNPHNVTKSQIGLGDVSNYPTAVESEAISGTATDRLITPYGVSQYASAHVKGWYLTEEVVYDAGDTRGNIWHGSRSMTFDDLGSIDEINIIINRDSQEGSGYAQWAQQIFSVPIKSIRLGSTSYFPFVSYDGGANVSSSPSIAMMKFTFSESNGKLVMTGNDYQSTNNNAKTFIVRKIVLRRRKQIFS